MAKKAKDEKITREVAELGRQVERAIRSAAKSPELKGIGEEITRGLQRVGEKVVVAFETAKVSPQGRKVGDQLKKVVTMGRASSKVTAEKVRENLTKGLRGVGAELAKLAEKLDKKR